MVSAELSNLAKAVADPTRRRILELLRSGARPVSEIAALFPVSRPAISKHLRILREASLVGESRQGRQRVYEARVERLGLLAAWLEGLEAGTLPDLELGSPRVFVSERLGAEREADAARAAEELPETAADEWRSW